VTAGEGYFINASYCDSGANVVIADNASCGLWDFPSG
jgi:hypothetical protein